MESKNESRRLLGTLKGLRDWIRRLVA